MDRLPLELLGSFFQTLLPIPPRDFTFLPPGADRPETIQSLRLVSRSWNEAVLETPFVWSYIELSSRDADLLRVDPWLKRSKAAPLHIRVQLHSTDLERPEVKRAVEALWSEAYRWSTYVVAALLPVESIPEQGWFKLVPAVPLPNLQEAWVMGSQYSSLVTELNAPRISTLVEHGLLIDIEPTNLPDFRSWALAAPSRRLEWERLAQVVKASPKLAILQLAAAPKEDTTGVWEIGEIMQDVTFPALMKLIISPSRTSFGILDKIRAPYLEVLVIENYFFESPFSIPTPSSCPTLKRIRFSGNPRLSAVRARVSQMAPGDLERLIVEIEIRQFSRTPAGEETPAFRRFQEQVKWFQANCLVNWIQI